MRSFIFRILSKVFSILLPVILLGYLAFPILLIYVPHSVDFFVFLNHVALPFTRNFSDLPHFGLDHHQATAHFVKSPDGIMLGTWHIQPPSGVKSRQQVILYHHGNSGTRGTPHRIALYEVLASAGFDVIAFDYRGYADSYCIDRNADNCEPTEQRLITDTQTLYKWSLDIIKKQWNGNEESIIIWGHSLGGGAATNLAYSLCPQTTSNCKMARALILESTFSDVVQAALRYPIVWPLRIHDKVLEIVPNALSIQNLKFNNTDTLQKLRLPVLMLHAEDDLIVPASLSLHAFNAADSARPDDWPPIEYKMFDSKFWYGHRSLHDAPELIPYLLDFLK